MNTASSFLDFVLTSPMKQNVKDRPSFLPVEFLCPLLLDWRTSLGLYFCDNCEGPKQPVWLLAGRLATTGSLEGQHFKKTGKTRLTQ
ncbi:hypothetical protein OS493_027431 [Desmophyllum pertusum]|uniref:Uncharacterized protein n=1 Tax=Desmophyllum pertusum TaxID=174260 RepID=A0A9W9YKP6_9CNID|nr:hypothetical protein OS493_027431 [Desmophyllum pertusum]